MDHVSETPRPAAASDAATLDPAAAGAVSTDPATQIIVPGAAAPSVVPDLTRRGFLRGAAITGGGLVAATLAACAPASPTPGWTYGPIATPAAGLVMGNVTVSGTATDPEYSLDSVETRIDGGAWGAAIGTDPWSTTWDSSTVPDGTHAIEARAYDGALYSPVCSVTVTTDNGVVPPPDGDFLRDYGWVLAVFFATGIALALMVVLLRRRRTKGES